MIVSVFDTHHFDRAPRWKKKKCAHQAMISIFLKHGWNGRKPAKLAAGSLAVSVFVNDVLLDRPTLTTLHENRGPPWSIALRCARLQSGRLGGSQYLGLITRVPDYSPSRWLNMPWLFCWR